MQNDQISKMIKYQSPGLGFIVSDRLRNLNKRNQGEDEKEYVSSTG